MKKKTFELCLFFLWGARLARNDGASEAKIGNSGPILPTKKKWKGSLAHSISLAFSFQCIVFRFVVLLKPILCPRSEFSQIVYRSYLHIYIYAISKVDSYEYNNVGRLFCTPAPPKFTKKLAVDSFFNFGS